MRDIIDRILDGKFQPDTGALDFSCSKIEIELTAGEDYEGAFEIYGPVNQLTEGYVFTNGLEMECFTDEFAGAVSEIAFSFHAQNIEEGSSREGEFVIISNHGEYTIPYKIVIVPGEIMSSLGAVKNLFHFTNLAKTNWEEAVNLFYSEDFYRVFQGTDRQYYPLYRGLSGGKDKKNEQNVEEFLQVVKKKQRIEYLVSETQIRIDAPEEPTEYTLTINRNGWGYTWLRVQAEGDFLRIDKEYIREEDFLGNFYRLPYYISAEKLHAGYNMGKIRIYNAHMEMIIPITVSKQTGLPKRKSLRREQKHHILELMEYYAAFRTKKISAATWRKETAKLVDKMVAFNDQDVSAKLFKAQLLITEERYNEANWMLDHADALLQSNEEWEPALWCYYQYLTTLHSGEEEYIDAVAAQVERIFTQNSDNWRVAWLLTYLMEDYNKSPSKKWMILEEQFKRNCSSPVIYIEALHLLQQNPTLLMKMEGFERHILLYAAKKELLTPELISQIVYLISKSKEYSGFLFQILKACYRVAPSDEVVKVICGLLIKGNCRGTEYLQWYKLGIERELRVTRLYEYYLMSVDLETDEKLPKMVLMYFAYNSDMDYRYNAYLYANVHKYREDFPELYESYQESIERFVVQQMAKGHMNKWLAYLYKNIISPGMITPDNAAGLAEALFTMQVTVQRKDIREIIVIYDKGKTEITYPVGGRQNYIPLYGNGFHVFLEDYEGNRYAGEENYTIEKLIWPDKLAKMAAPMVRDLIGFDLWMCEQGDDIALVTDANREAMVRVLETDYLADSYQKEIRIKLIRYLYEQDLIEQLDKILNTIEVTQVASRNYAEILKLMIVRYMYSRAYEWMTIIGTAGMDAKQMLRVLRAVLAEEKVSADKKMTVLAYTAFAAGKYDERLLQYLNRFYKGTIRQMRNIWKAAKDFTLDTYELSERLLIQMLYSGSFVGEQIAIFKDYVVGGGKNRVEAAFLAQCAYNYFVHDKVTDVFVINQMVRALERREELDLICKLAFVKYFAENSGEIDEGVKAILQPFLKQLIKQNIYFSFYKEYVETFPFMEQFLDKTIIEYRAKSGNTAIIHYLIERDGVGKSEYTKEEMRDMYGGVCAKQFVLFFGEQLLYYIAEKEEDKEHLTESASISKSDIIGEQRECKFNQINDIAIAKMLQDYETVNSLLYDFYRQEFVVEQLFHLQT